MNKRNIIKHAKKLKRSAELLISSEKCEFIRKKLLFKSGMHNFTQSEPCVFVLSTGRVGSQTIAALLKGTNNIISLHEPKPSLYALSRYSYQNEIDTSDSVYNQLVLSMREDKLARCMRYGVGYIETSPQSTFIAPYLAEQIPQVRFIHLIRNPVSVIRSGMRRDWYAGNPNDKYRITPLKNSKYFSEWNGFSNFQKNVWLWAETNRWIFEFTNSYENQCLYIESEDIFSKDEQALNSLYSFCGCSVPAGHKINRVLSKKLNSQVTGSFPDINNWPEREVQQFKEITMDLLSDTPYLEKILRIVGE